MKLSENIKEKIEHSLDILSTEETCVLSSIHGYRNKMAQRRLNSIRINIGRSAKNKINVGLFISEEEKNNLIELLESLKLEE